MSNTSGLITSSPYNPLGGFGIPELVPVRVEPSRDQGSRLNFVIPVIYDKWWFGGPATALRLFETLAKEFDRARIVLPNQAESQFDFSKWPGWVVDHGQDAPRSIAFLGDETTSLRVSAGDFFLATFWSTAVYIKQVIARQTQLFPEASHRFLYAIQDYEPSFYAASARYEHARSTYENRDSVIAVFNSQPLADYFHNNGLIFSEQHVFEPTFHPQLSHKRTELATCSKERLILVYGRPSIARNDFDLAVDALRIWAKSFPSAAAWSVVSAGEPHPDLPLADQAVLRSRGKLTLDEYALHLARSWAGLSFMYSPHPSYPPLEMAEFGAWVITNNYENKNLSELAPNIISLTQPTPESVAEKLAWSCYQFEYGVTVADRNTAPVFRGGSDEFPFSRALAKSWKQPALTRIRSVG